MPLPSSQLRRDRVERTVSGVIITQEMEVTPLYMESRFVEASVMLNRNTIRRLKLLFPKSVAPMSKRYFNLYI